MTPALGDVPTAPSWNAFRTRRLITIQCPLSRPSESRQSGRRHTCGQRRLVDEAEGAVRLNRPVDHVVQHPSSEDHDLRLEY
jgi:hypothetical protein